MLVLKSGRRLEGRLWELFSTILRTTTIHSYKPTHMSSSYRCTRVCWLRFSLRFFVFLCFFLPRASVFVLCVLLTAHSSPPTDIIWALMTVSWLTDWLTDWLTGTYRRYVDAAEVTTGELSVTTRRIITVNLITIVSTVVIMITPPLWRDTAAVSTDERRRRTGALGAVASIFIRPATNAERVNLRRSVYCIQ